MRPYETMVVLSGTLGTESQALLERLENLITASGGRLDARRDWGVRKLAYPIKKHSDGHYYLIEYHADGALVAELERNLRITDGVLRFISVQQEHTGLPEPRQRESSRRDVPMSEMRSRPPRGPETPAAPAPQPEPARAEGGAETGAGQEASASGGEASAPPATEENKDE